MELLFKNELAAEAALPDGLISWEKLASQLQMVPFLIDNLNAGHATPGKQWARNSEQCPL